MKKEELLKLAKENKDVADAIIFLTKSAQAATNFDESVPGVGGAQQDPNAVAGAAPAVAAAPVAPPAGAGAIPADQQAMAMAGQPAGPAPIDPGQEGAKAAQAFLAPAFQAAAQGDQGAQKTIAMAAGEVARGVAAAANEASAGGAPPEAAMAPPPSPEEQVADQVVAVPDQAKANAKPEEEEGKKKGEEKKEKDKEKKPPFEKNSELMFSADTVRGLIQLSKAGII